MKNKKKIHILISGGGSGGHVFVGLSVAKYLINTGCSVTWIGAKKKIESRLIPKNKIPITYFYVSGFCGKNIFLKFVSIIKMIYASFKAKTFIKKIQPDIVFSTGGYASLPGSIASWMLSIPLVIHEQNRVPGLANFLIFKLSNCKILQAFPNTFPHSKVVGNPIRDDILHINTPEIRFQKRSGPLRLLILGGSQGASILNDMIPSILKRLPNKFHVIHQSGSYEHIKVKNKYKQLSSNIKYKVAMFIKNIYKAYNWADLVICRSGALTVSEIAYIGLAALFIPYPHKDNQQYWNAKILESVGAAKIILQNQSTKKNILKILNSWNREKSLIMSKKSKNLKIKNATKKIVYEIYQLLNIAQ
ncbi:MAG: undecaprenyldiphospho-muramoylpentapeptide beta-N-acetylglucosaminyltransferase [Wigglesworthia glossinidia]|nr:undecaprenyldiphospho-muramoylpentapeptide beta-N-acetylglucosaminyltransferase [Wigglesworthia glossinidia]